VAAPPPPPAPLPAPPPIAAAPAPAPNGSAFAASASAPQPTTGTQLIQVAAVGDIAKGRDLQRQLRAAGFDAYWESVRAQNKKGDIVRVRISVDRATQNVAETLADLKKRGFDPILVNP
jgi:cell division septation protein DedD